MPDYLPIESLMQGGVYECQARNFSIGVWDGSHCLLGIRAKFDASYLDGELHRDASGLIGTAMPLRLLWQVPEGIPLETKKPVDGKMSFDVPLYHWLKKFIAERPDKEEPPKDFGKQWKTWGLRFGATPATSDEILGEGTQT